MYALQGDNLLAQTLESENFTGYAKRLAHELVLQAIKEDPSLLTGLQNSVPNNPSSYAKTTQDNPVSRFVRYRKSQERKRHIDTYLHNVTPRFLTQVVRFLRSHRYEVVLTVDPHDAEERILYGGTSREVRLRIWVAIKNAGNIFIAECRTRNKSEVAVVIAAVGAEYKTRMNENSHHVTDVYFSPIANTMQKKFRLWESES